MKIKTKNQLIFCKLNLISSFFFHPKKEGYLSNKKFQIELIKLCMSSDFKKKLPLLEGNNVESSS